MNKVPFRTNNCASSILYLFLSSFMLFAASVLTAADKIFTYNILSDRYLSHAGYDVYPHHIVASEFRSVRILDKIVDSSPDIIQLQEVEEDVFTFLKSSLRHHGYLGVLAINPKRQKDSVATFYKEEKFDMLNYRVHNFPQSTKSFLELTLRYRGQQLVFSTFNVKLKWDNPDIESQRQGDEQLKFLISYLGGLSTPFLLSGDFNLVPDSKGIKKLNFFLKDAHQHTDCNSICIQGQGKKVDYIFSSKDVDLEPYDTLEFCNSTVSGLSLNNPSDHYSLSAKFFIKKLSSPIALTHD